jgi:pimeloyl-ACP methyl ester carboxylesterase
MSNAAGLVGRLDMKNQSTLFAAALVAVISCNSEPTREAPVQKPTTPTTTKAATTGRVPVNGVDYYYEIHGEGEPILVLHGGLMSMDSYLPLLPALTDGRKVIAVDLQGHGRTTLGTRPITLEGSANDLDALLEKIGVPQVDVVGYSFGGGIAFRLAVQHPQRVRRLVIASAPFAQDGWFPEMLPQQAALSAAAMPMLKDSPMYQQYVAVAPNPDDFPALLDRMGEWMRTPYNYADDVKKLTVPTLLVFGDSDMVRLEHITEFYKLIGGAQKDAGWQREHMAKNRLAILPDVTHYETMTAPMFVPTIRPFLDGKTGPKTDQLSSR